MNPLPLSELAALCGAPPPARGGDTAVSRVSKDTRTLAAGDLYFALRGESFDGNAFAREAAARGAAGAVLDDPAAAREVPSDFPVILVEDGAAALHRLAAAWRDRLGLRAVCITGSNGKTSTKEFTAAVLSSRFPTTKTEGNLNNHIGLPLTILAAETGHKAAVWEIGMNHPGEIAPLAAIAKPDAAIVTNIGVAHIEYMGSREAIAREKSALLAALPPAGTAIFPGSDDFADTLAASTRARVVRTGGPDLHAADLRISADETAFTLVVDGARIPARVPAPGAHMVANALLAIAAGLALGLAPEECVAGLATARNASGRLARKSLRDVLFLDDTYNANPDSMVAALGVLAGIPGGKKIAVLGRMGELGSHADEGYRRTGIAAAASAGALIAVGPETAPLAEAAEAAGLAHVVRAGDVAAAAAALREIAGAGDVVLVKGSRSARMERVLEEF